MSNLEIIVYENKSLRKTFGPKSEKVTGDW